MDREVAEHELIDRLFYFWDFEHRGSLSLQVRNNRLLDIDDPHFLLESCRRVGWCNVQWTHGEHRMVF